MIYFLQVMIGRDTMLKKVSLCNDRVFETKAAFFRIFL